MFRPGWAEILAVLLLIKLLIGARRLPELARALGRRLNEFKKGQIEPEKHQDTTDINGQN